MDSGSSLPPLSALDKGLRGSNRIFEDSLQSELNSILHEQRKQLIGNQERDLNMYRSGSAPPTVEGSLSAVGSLFGVQPEQIVNSSNNNGSILSEEEIRSHPAYLQYYYSHEHLNPRLPPPLLSKEDWRVAQRFQAGGSRIGSFGDWGKKNIDDGDGSSMYSMQTGPFVTKDESDMMKPRNIGGRNIPSQTSSEWLDRSSSGQSGLGAGLGARRKSFADFIQEGLGQASLSVSGHPSRPASCNSFGNLVDNSSIHNPNRSSCNGVESLNGLYSGSTASRMVSLPSHSTMLPNSFPAAVGSSLTRSKTPESQIFTSSSGSGMPPMSNNACASGKNGIGTNINHGHSSSMPDLADITASLSGLNLSNVRNTDANNRVKYEFEVNIANQSSGPIPRPARPNLGLQQNFFNSSNPGKHACSTNFASVARENGMTTDLNASEISYNRKTSMPNRAFSSPSLYSEANAAGAGSLEGSNFHYQHATAPDSCLTADGDEGKLNKIRHHVGPSNQSEIAGPQCAHYRQRTSDYAPEGGFIPGDSSQLRNYYHTSYGHLAEYQRAYLASLLAQQRQQYQLSPLDKFGGLSHPYAGNKKYGVGMPYSGNLTENPMLQGVGYGGPMFQNEPISHFTPMMRSPMGGPTGSWSLDAGNNGEEIISSSLLDELKNNKTRHFKLSEIVDHVAEFSMDQYGSRFIQQKLETATVEEKMKIFPEIIPHARTLMTDVFGNYVVQKFFEHGTESQRKELASQLKGHVLPLSLQMYGCRVIQKALEVVDIDRQTQMVAELDGSIMRCVRDQNGNHVIQKCIECVPQDRIQFIITAFYGQVVPLSMHPYGCRVIQRVLEHCHDPNTQHIIMNEIMQSVPVLAQDQYGNYVIQHVLEHGKAHERSEIIRKLSGQIVSMSQQKFASNVVEKCLSFGSPEERQLLVKEILGSSNEDDPLEALMKDPFGNYVVQKVLETCDAQTLEVILSRIKIHLNSLKKYTFGKHIVSRTEKLIMTGERRIGLAASSS